MRLVDVRKPRVLLGVDHKWRDLQSYTYLKLLLEERYGLEVFLVRRTWERFYLSLVRPDIVIFEGFFYDQWATLARNLHELGIKIVILPTEGAPADLASKERLAGKHGDFSIIDLYLSWNEEIRNLILEFGTMPAEKVKVTGPPRMDFYRPPMNRLIEDRAQFLRSYDLSPDRPTITFAPNFCFAGMADDRPDLLAHERRAVTGPNGEVNPFEDPYVLMEDERKIRAAMMESLARLRKDFPDVNLLLRPHPAESHVFYRDFLNRAGLRDVPIVYTKHIWDVLNATDVMIVRNSTASFDAWMAGRHTIEFQIDASDFSRTVGKEFARGSELVQSYDELRQSVAAGLERRGVPPETQGAREQVLQAYFHRTDGGATDRVGQALRELAESIPYSPGKDGAVTRRFMSQSHKAVLGELRGFFKGGFVKHLLGGSGSVDYLGRFDRFIYPSDLRLSLRQMRGLRRVWAR